MIWMSAWCCIHIHRLSHYQQWLSKDDYDDDDDDGEIILSNCDEKSDISIILCVSKEKCHTKFDDSL